MIVYIKYYQGGATIELAVNVYDLIDKILRNGLIWKITPIIANLNKSS